MSAYKYRCRRVVPTSLGPPKPTLRHPHKRGAGNSDKNSEGAPSSVSVPERLRLCVFSPARIARLGSRVPEVGAPGHQLAVMSCGMHTGSFSACSWSWAGAGSRGGERIDTRDGVDLIEVPVCGQQPLHAAGLHRRDVQSSSCRQPGMPRQQFGSACRQASRYGASLPARYMNTLASTNSESRTLVNCPLDSPDLRECRTKETDGEQRESPLGLPGAQPPQMGRRQTRISSSIAAISFSTCRMSASISSKGRGGRYS